MPTPSDSTPRLNAASVIEDLSARATCPPEPERLTSWREELDSPALIERDSTPDNVPSPSVASPQPVPIRSDNATVRGDSEPLKVEMETSASPSSMSRSDDEPSMGRVSPTRRTANSAAAVPPSPSTLLSYEFSNIRVCDLRGMSSYYIQLT